MNKDLELAIRCILREHAPSLREPITTRIVVALEGLLNNKPEPIPSEFSSKINNLSDATWEIVEQLRSINKDLRSRSVVSVKDKISDTLKIKSEE